MCTVSAGIMGRPLHLLCLLITLFQSANSRAVISLEGKKKDLVLFSFSSLSLQGEKTSILIAFLLEIFKGLRILGVIG